MLDTYYVNDSASNIILFLSVAEYQLPDNGTNEYIRIFLT